MGVRDLHDPPARRAAWFRRGPTRARLLAGAAFASVAALLVTAVWAADREHGRRSTSRDLVRVGVVQGQSVPGYLRSSRGELDTMLQAPDAAPDTYALVTLTDYVTPDRLAGVLAGVAVAEVYARVPIASVQTQVVRIPAYRLPDDVLAGMLSLAQRRDREQADYRHLGGSLTRGGAAEERLRRAYAGAAEVATAEAAAYRAGCSCLFAAVVLAAPAVLDRLDRHRDVRAVDPAPEVRRLDRTEFRPPLPEEQGIVPEAPPPASVPGPSGSPPGSSAPPGAGRSMPPALASTATIVTPASPGDPGVESWASAGAVGPSAAVPSALLPGPGTDVPSATVGASRGASGR